MFDIYNEAWQHNWGFVPFTKEEFFDNLDNLRLIWNPELFLIAYVKGTPGAFCGAVPNIVEKMRPIPGFRRVELLRTVRMFLTTGLIKNYRMGYFGVRPKYRRIGLDAVLVTEAKRYAIGRNYQSCDIGWVLEDNKLALRLMHSMGDI
jgi:GNAT superfamily N-acetyltransferase